MFAQRPGAGRDEVGEKVASFPTYEQAQAAVSALIAGEVPARDIAIVGSGLRSIERITGKLGYATAARSGALNGLMLGMLFAFIFVLGMPTVQISAFVGVLLVGMALGMLLSLGTYSIVRRRRDFASVMQVAADHYDVCVGAGSVQKARGVLGSTGTRTVVARPPATDTAPPQYGERVSRGAATPPRPSAPAATPIDDAPPRYGERIAPPTTAPADTPSASPAGPPASGSVAPTDAPRPGEADQPGPAPEPEEVSPSGDARKPSDDAARPADANRPGDTSPER